MTNSVEKSMVICFTDIVNSTADTLFKGVDQYSVYRKEHEDLLKSLARRFEGRYVKGTGDGGLLAFESTKSALSFASNVQFYYQDLPSKMSACIQIRIGLHRGLVKVEKNGDKEEFDVFGNSVNFASRLESNAPVGTILVSNNILQDLEDMYGKNSHALFWGKSHSLKFKGYDEEVGAYELNRDYFFHENKEVSFPALAHAHLSSLGINFSNVTIDDFLSPGVLLWPVVPRSHVNLLHHGFIEIMRIFALAGWSIEILLADFGKDELKEEDLKDFTEKLCEILGKRNVRPAEIYKLSDFITKANQSDCCALTHDFFYPSLKAIKGVAMKSIIVKKYLIDEAFPQEKSTLNILQPILTLAGVRLLLKKRGESENKNIVLSGIDEKDMWEKCVTLERRERHKLAAAQIGLLETSKSQYNQNTTDLYWLSEQSLLEDMKKDDSNIKKWSYDHIFAMSQFPFLYKNEENDPVDDDAVVVKAIMKRLSM